MIINQTIHIELAPEGPKIIDGYWHEWVNGEWVNTGRKAEGEDGTDGYSVSLSKSEHTFNYDKNGNLKGILSDGAISVEVFNGATPLICDSLGVLAPTTDGTYRVTDITISPSTTLSYNVDRLNNMFRLIPTMIDAEEVRVTFTIVARTKGVNTTFTRHLKYQKRHDGADGVPGADGFTVSMSKNSHTYVTDSAGNIKGALSSGAVAVLVRNGNTIFTCPSTSWHSIPANGQYVVTSVDAPGTLPMSFSLSNNQYVLTPMALAVTEARVVVTITAKMNNILYYFSAEITYNKVSDGGQGSTGDGVVHIYRQFPTKPSVPGAGIANPAGWSRNPDFLLSITDPTNWTLNGKWYQSEELTAIGNSAISKIDFTTSKDNQTISIELWGDGSATYDYVYAGNLNTPVSTSNYYDRISVGKKVITYEVPSAGDHYIEIIWKKGITTISGSNRGYFSIIENVKVWRSANSVIAGVYQIWSDPSAFMIDTSTEERIYCLSKTTASPLISDSDAYVDDYIPLPCALSSYRGDFSTYRAYSVGQVVVYQLDFYKVVKAVNSLYTGDPTNTEYFEKIKSWTDNPTGANKEYPYEIVGIRNKVDGLWGPFVTSVWSNFGFGSNYLQMGFWDADTSYAITNAGIPLVKKTDETSLGYSVYTLKAALSTLGSFILSEWTLVESAEFMYMQDAYIERLQAQLVTADRIDALQITSKIVRTAAYGSRTEIEGNTIKIFNDTSIFPNIVFGMKNGYAVMEYYDNDGVMLYDLGPEGISMVDVVEEAWIEVSNLLFLGIDYTTVLTTPAIKSKYKRPLLQSQVTYYKYQSQRIGNVVSDPDNDGRLFVSPSKAANKIPIGVYCLRQNAFQYNLFGQPYSIPTRQHPSNESYYTTSAYQIYFQPLYNSHPASPGLIGSSLYDAYWSEKIGLPPAEL